MTSSDVAEVRARLADPKAVVTALGLERGATRHPRGLMVCCPSHGDRTPSCSVRVGRDGTIQVKCFACDFAGDVFAIVAAVEALLRANYTLGLSSVMSVEVVGLSYQLTQGSDGTRVVVPFTVRIRSVI